MSIIHKDAPSSDPTIDVSDPTTTTAPSDRSCFVPTVIVTDPDKYKHICFIDPAVTSFADYLNPETYPVIYRTETTRETLKTFLLAQKFTHVDRISFVFHGTPAANPLLFTPKSFIDNQPFFSLSSDENQSQNQVFLQELFDSLNVKHVDFLACNLLQHQEWKDFFSTFKNVVVGASLDNTGNVHYGGNWVMENTMENVRDLYFTADIENFATLLVVYVYTYTDPSGNSYPFNFTISGSNATISGFTNPTVLTAVTVPDTVYINTTGYTVTTIGTGAFSAKDKITALTFPPSVTTIMEGAAGNCTKLVSVTMTNVTTIGPYAFNAQNAVSTSSSLTTVNFLADTLISMANWSFAFTTKLTTFRFPSTLQTIGSEAFYGSGIRTAVVLPAGCNTIGYGAFRDTSRMTSITLGEGLVNIPNDFCAGSYNLTTVVFPSTIKTIGSNAFLAAKFTTIALPTGLLTIGAFAFRASTAVFVGSLVIPDTVTSVGEESFYGVGATSLTLSNKLITIGKNAFGLMNQITTLTIPSSVRTIGYCAFSDCSQLASMTIENGVTSIGELAFTNNIKLVGVILPNSVTSIGISAFKGCTSLVSANIPTGVLTIGTFVFQNCTKLKAITIPSSLSLISSSAFLGCTELTTVIITKGVVTIGDNAFQNCTKLTSCSIPNSVTSIGGYTFNTCSSLTSITIPSSVLSLGQYSFTACSKLATVNLAYGLTSIGMNAFNQCTSLTSIRIPKSVSGTVSSWTFATTKITRIEFPLGQTTIANNLFNGCTMLTSAVIPKDITVIQTMAYTGCIALAKVFFTGNAIPLPTASWFTTTGTSAQIFYLESASATVLNLDTIAGTKISKTPFEMYNLLINAGYDRTYSANAIYGFKSTFTFTQSNIQSAVNDWCSDPVTATATYGHIATWNTVGVTDMSGLFSGKTTFSDDISLWDTSNVTNMDNMFNNASAFNTTLNLWNLSKVTSVANMFVNATAFNQDISLWELPLISTIPPGFSGMTDSKFYPNWGKYKLTLNGQLYNTVYQNRLYVDAGVSDLYSTIITTGAVIDTSVIGSYIVEYNASAAVTGKSNPSYAVRYVSVIADPTPPLTVTFPSTTTLISKGNSVSVSSFQPTAVTWRSSVDGGYTWTTRAKTTVAFTLSDATYARNDIQLFFVDGSGNSSAVVSNGSQIVINLEGPTGLGVSFPLSTSLNNKVNTVTLPIVPSDAVSWKYSIDSGVTWTSRNFTSDNSFVLPEAVYTINTVQVMCTDVLDNNSALVKNGYVINIDLTGPYGSTVTFPPSTSVANRGTTATVNFTSIPSDAISWQYSVDSGVTWVSRDVLSTSFILADATYEPDSIRMRCADAAGNNSTTISNTEQIIINFYNGFIPPIAIPITGGPVPIDFSTDLTNSAIVGSTSTEQRTFTMNLMKSIFSSNTNNQQLVLKSGNVLPGFSNLLTKDIYLFNSSTSQPPVVVTGSATPFAVVGSTLIRKSQIMSRSFYILLESGETVYIETNTDTVTISKSGSLFTISTRVTVKTAVVGEVFDYDGLYVTMGSVYGTLTPTLVDFVLTALNTGITLSSSALLPDYSPKIISDATITLTNKVSPSVLQETFYYRTDEQITTDASFVYYYVDTAKWTSANRDINPKNGTVTLNRYVQNDPVGKDFLRDLARQLFGTYLGADLFTNEDSFVSNINMNCDNVANAITLLLSSVDKTSGSFSGMAIDSSGNKYLDDNDSVSNISREIFNQLVTLAPGRFDDIKTDYKYNANVEDGFYRIPFLSGDTLTFKLTISPAGTQRSAVPTSSSLLKSRTYTVVLVVGE
jgi:hypothetical protein